MTQMERITAVILYLVMPISARRSVKNGLEVEINAFSLAMVMYLYFCANHHLQTRRLSLKKVTKIGT